MPPSTSSTTPWLARPAADFSKAFPEIEEISISVEHDTLGFHDLSDWQRNSTYSIANVPPEIACVNQRCQRGGLDLQSCIQNRVSQKETHYVGEFACNGDEGSPKGRRPGQRCLNNSRVTIEIRYKQASD